MRRIQRNIDSTTGDITDFIEKNPVTSAVVALAAGALATSVFKMAVGRPGQEKAAPGPGADAAVQPRSRASAASGKPAKKTARKAAKKPAAVRKRRAKP